MTDLATLGLVVRSDGVVVASKRLRDFEQQAGRTETIATRMGGAVTRMAVQLAAAAASALSVGAAVRAYADFERGLIGIGKTADISGAQLRALGADIQVIAREVPIATTELLGIAMAAGQLGVSGSDNILRFTETVGKLGLASDLAGEMAATTLARILTVTGTAIRDVDRLGSTIVQLGNNFAATESEIAGATTRVAQATAQFNVAASEVTGIGAALTAVGVQAEAGGTVIGRAFQSINDAVRQGGEELTAFTQITGLSSAALKNLFLEDPTAAFQSLIEGLGRINASGGDVTAALEAVGLEGVRVVQVLGTLATRSDVLADALAMANAEWVENTALNQEAATAAQAFTAQVQVMQNAINEAGVALGEMIAPALLVGVRGLTAVFQTLAENMDRVATYAATAAVAGMIAFRGAIFAAATAAWGFVSALVATRAALIRTGIGLAVVAAGELVYQFLQLVEKTGGWGNALSLLGEVAAGVWDGISTSAQSIPPALAAVWVDIQADFVDMIGKLAGIWNAFLAEFEAPAFTVTVGGQTHEIIGSLDLSEWKINAGDFNSLVAGMRTNADGLRESAASLATDGLDKAAGALSRLNQVVNGQSGNAPGTPGSRGRGDGDTSVPGFAGAAGSLGDFGGGAAAQLNAYQEATKAVRDNIAALEQQALTFGLSETAASRFNTAMDLLRAAEEAKIPVTDKLINEINGLADAYAIAEERARTMQEQIQFSRATFTGFFTDAWSNIRNSMSEWKTFGDAVKGVWDGIGKAGMAALEKITQRAIEMAASGIFDMILGALMPMGGSIYGRPVTFTPGVGYMPSFDGGGWTGNGPRVGGLDGKGGFAAMLHPQERVIDTTRGLGSPARNDNLNVHVTVGVSADNDGNLRPFVESVSTQSAARVTAAAAPGIVEQSKGATGSALRGGDYDNAMGRYGVRPQAKVR